MLLDLCEGMADLCGAMGTGMIFPSTSPPPQKKNVVIVPDMFCLDTMMGLVSGGIIWSHHW